jgi:hypothetical protein
LASAQPFSSVWLRVVCSALLCWQPTSPISKIPCHLPPNSTSLFASPTKCVLTTTHTFAPRTLLCALALILFHKSIQPFSILLPLHYLHRYTLEFVHLADLRLATFKESFSSHLYTGSQLGSSQTFAFLVQITDPTNCVLSLYHAIASSLHFRCISPTQPDFATL